MKKEHVSGQDFFLAVIISIIGSLILVSTERTGLVDMSVEGVIFFIGSIIAFKGFVRSRDIVNKDFKKFELFFGLAYLTVVISFIIGIYYYLINPQIAEIGVADLSGSNWLILMSLLKTVSMFLVILCWIYFYRSLEIVKPLGRKIKVYLLGFLLYLGASIIIWQITDDITVLSLGVIVGAIIGIFALIAQDKRTRYLTVIFTAYSSIHLIEFYLMGIGKSLTTGLNNPVYWAVTVLYVLEVRRWINRKLTVK